MIYIPSNVSEWAICVSNTAPKRSASPDFVIPIGIYETNPDYDN
jgi:hypothetical protein